METKYREIKEDYKEIKKENKLNLKLTIASGITKLIIIVGTYAGFMFYSLHSANNLEEKFNHMNSRIDYTYNLILEQDKEFDTWYKDQQKLNQELLNKMNDFQHTLDTIYDRQ